MKEFANKDIKTAPINTLKNTGENRNMARREGEV
jgi:hypothetical protein